MKHAISMTGLALAFAALLAAHVHAAERGKGCSPTSKSSQDVAYVVAQYSVPSLTKKSAKRLARTVTKQPGLISAKPDFKEKTFSVVFESGKTSSADILTALKKQAPGATLGAEGPFERKATGSACEGCPGRNSCPSAQAKK